MWVNTRYDKQNVVALGLAPPAPTLGYPVLPSGENLLRGGTKWVANGHGVAAQKWASWLACASRAEVDEWLDDLAASGVNSLSLGSPEPYGRAPSGQYAGRQVGCFDDGYAYADVTGRTWQVGDKCATVEGSNSRCNTYECTTGGVGSGSVGPTGTGSSIALGATVWKYLYPTWSVYSEEFFAGTASAAGFDYVMAACNRRGIYILLRFFSWKAVFRGRMSGYPLSGGGNMANYYGAWALDGEYGTPTYLTFQKEHIATFLNRVNTVNGLRYGNDPTLYAIDLNNEAGYGYFWQNTGSATSPSGDTFDRLCFSGSVSPSNPADINSTLVAAYDSLYLAWYAANYGGSTPNADFPGQLNTLPCYAYNLLNAGPANNVAQRMTFRAVGTGTPPSDSLVEWRRRVYRFWAELERDRHVVPLYNYVKSISTNKIVYAGQIGWPFALSLFAGDLIDVHHYDNATNSTTGNTQSVSGTLSWAAGTVTVSAISGVDVSHPLIVGQLVRITQVASPFASALYTIAGNTGNTALTATAADPGFTGAVTVGLPTTDLNYCPWHNEPPGTNVASSTRAHAYIRGTPGEQDIDVASFLGNNNYGVYAVSGLRGGNIEGKPKITSELGCRGPWGPNIKGYSAIVYYLLDMLQGGSGAYLFSWINGYKQPGNFEHSIPGDGTSFMSSQIMALLGRPGMIAPLPGVDSTQVTEDDVFSFGAAHNAVENVGGPSGTWPYFIDTTGFALSGQSSWWGAFLWRRLRWKIGATSAKTALNDYSISSSGQVFSVTDPTAGRIYHQHNIGYTTFENQKVCFIWGRLPASTSQPTDMTKMQISTADGKLWYGFVIWISLDGSDLGVGRSVLYTWMSGREEVQQFSRFQMTSRVQAVEITDTTDISGGTDDAIQPGVVMRNGLRVKLTMPAEKAATVVERYGATRSHGAFYKSGALWLNPVRPLIVIG